MNERKNYDEEFLKVFFNWAVVIHADFSTIQEIKQFLLDKDVEIRFQKISTNYLKIIEGE